MRSTILYLGGILMLILSCKPVQEVTQGPISSNQKEIAISRNDIVQPLSYGEVPNDDTVRTGKLENGLTYFIMPNQKPEDRAELRLIVKAGSIDEDANQLGLAHFIEHMAFNGTKNFEKNELVDYLESVGSRFGPDLNAYTSFDETVYMLQVRTDDEKQLEKGLLVLSDWASGLTFDPEEVDKERGVVISEWRSRLSPDQRMSNEYLPVLLKGSRYANRLPIGDPDIVENADLSTIKKFYYNWYRPDLMAVVVVGDVDQNLMEEYVREYFQSVPKAISPRKKKSYEVPEHEETLVKVVSDKEAAFTRVQIVHKMKPEKIWSLKEYIGQLESSLISQMLTNRLQELTQKADAPFIFANARHGDAIGPMDAFTLFGVTAEGESLKGIKALMQEVTRAQQHGFTLGELQRAKEEMEKSAETRLAEKDKTESRNHASRLVNHFLKDKPYPSAEDYHWIIKKYVGLITMENLETRLQSWLGTENRVVIVTSPDKEDLKLPNQNEILAAIAEMESARYEAYVDDVAEGPLADISSDPIEITSEETITSNEIEHLILENGVNLYLKATDFNNDEIVFEARAKGGSSVFSEEEYIHARMASQIVNESGFGNFSDSDLQKKLAGKEVEMYPYIQDYRQGLRGSCSVSDLRELMDLIYLSFTGVRKDTEAFQAFMKRTEDIYANLNSDPRYFFNNESQKWMYNNHPRRQLPTVEDLRSVDLDKSLSAFSKLFANGKDFDFVFVGNLDADKKKAIIQTLGHLPTSAMTMEPMDVNLNVVDGVKKIWSKGEAPKTFVQLAYAGDRMDGRANDIALRGFRDVLNIKLRESLREDKGGVYGVRVGMRMPDFPLQKYLLTIGFNCDPDRADELIAEAKKVMFDLIDNGPSETDLGKVKEIQKQQLSKGFKENQFWLRGMMATIDKGRDLKNMTQSKKEEDLTILTKANILRQGEHIRSTGKLISLVQKPE